MKSIREDLDITQVALARVSGLTRQGISLIERGLRRPTAATLRALEHAAEIIHLQNFKPYIRKSGEHSDEESWAAARRLQSVGTNELLSIKVRLTPYSMIKSLLDSEAYYQPDYSQDQLLDGLQARAIVRFFPNTFKVEILPGWWTVRDNYRIPLLRTQRQDLSFEEAQQRIIEEGPVDR